MIDEITQAIAQEILAYLKDANSEWADATVIERTDFEKSDSPTVTMPLVIWDEEGGDEFGQMIGGNTLCDYNIYIDVYNHRPDVYGNDLTGGSAGSKLIADQVRRHFSNYTTWLTDEMIGVFNTYGIKWTLSAVTKAAPLSHADGLVKGHRFVFATISWDLETSGSIDPGSVPLISVSQTNPPPANG